MRRHSAARAILYSRIGLFPNIFFNNHPHGGTTFLNMKNYKSLISTIHGTASPEFISILQFEVEYANTVRGGHLPMYLDQQKRQRLVSDINLLKTYEKRALIAPRAIIEN